MRNEDLSSNPTRRLILNYIVENPGISLPHIGSFFGLSRGTVRYHVKQLERSGMVRKEGSSKRPVYHATDESLTPGRVRGMSRDQVRVFRAVQGSSGMDMDELLSMTGMSKDELRYHLGRLSRKGLLIGESEGGKVLYRSIPKEEVNRRIYLELVRRLIDGEIDEGTFLFYSKKLGVR